MTAAGTAAAAAPESAAAAAFSVAHVFENKALPPLDLFTTARVAAPAKTAAVAAAAAAAATVATAADAAPAATAFGYFFSPSAPAENIETAPWRFFGHRGNS